MPVVAAAVTSLSYFVIYIAYYQYYHFFGMTPDAAGIDPGQVLSEVLIGPVATGVMGALLFLTLRVLVILSRRRFSLPAVTLPSTVWTAVLGAVVGIALGGAWVVRTAHTAAQRALTEGVPFSSVAVDLRVVQVQIGRAHV